MGGKVFSKGDNALHTPPMSPTVYNHVKAKCTIALQDLGFSRVVTPIEAAEKTSFGDVDIIASLEGTRLPPTAQLDASKWNEIEKALGASRSIPHGTVSPDKKMVIDDKSFAIPWPAGLGPAGDSKAASGPAYIQVDVRLCDTHQELKWRVFKHNHGDLWNMIGQTIRPFGLTADEFGLFIRVPELEGQDKKKARVFLTSDPAAVLDFLGLSRRNGESEKPFKSVNDLFEYAASCKWFMLWPKDQQVEEEKARDRSRVKNRPVFKRWADEFIPACRAKGRFLVSDPQQRTKAAVRDEVRREVFRTFPGSEAAYDFVLAGWNRERARVLVKNKIIKEDVCLPDDITPFLPTTTTSSEHGGGGGGDDAGEEYMRDLEKNWRGVLRSALAKVIIDDDDSFGGVDPPRLRDTEGVLQVDDVKDWINRNWERVGQVAWVLNCERARESVERKRRAAQGGQEAQPATGAATGGKR